jgi:hypothetical protein
MADEQLDCASGVTKVGSMSLLNSVIFFEGSVSAHYSLELERRSWHSTNQHEGGDFKGWVVNVDREDVISHAFPTSSAYNL